MTASYALDDYESVVAPPGGTVRLLGTNPIAIAAPTKSLPFVFDLLNNSDDYLTGVDDFLSIIRATPSMPGVQVRIPGDRTHAEREQRRREGVDLSQVSWDLLMECHDKLGLPAETLELEAR